MWLNFSVLLYAMGGKNLITPGFYNH